jgi:acetyl-CoA carboxylase biotin carboxylase subunit
MIRRVLIANRGEIACRIIRTCRAIGVSTVAVYSEPDADAPHVHLADEAVPIGPAPALESYLSIPRLIEAARKTNAEAVHPGYGFLSENADFAEACAMANLTFVGPTAGVMRRMGSKTGAREVVAKAGVPVVPGATPRLQTPEALSAAVKEVGFPALIKAAAGGGGKGMRVVRSEAEVGDAVGAARREAERAFANGTLYVERLIERPRHIEVQILADAEGDVVHVFERDCSLQRRHQKVIEETPAPHLSPAVRERITAAAVAVAKAVRYVNAGTVEFLLEGEGDDARFYFLEMNTRLQVEHPITEAVTGLDLVTLQLEIAARAPLPIRQGDIRPAGHAVECRVYAEDSHRLLPQAGRILHYREPVGAGLRVDSGVAEGTSVPVHYDPLLAKVITHGASRDEAFARMRQAIRDFEILGVRHNIAFLAALLADPDVLGGRTSTRFIEERLESLTAAPPRIISRAAAAVAATLTADRTEAAAPVPAPAAPASEGGESVPVFDPWDLIGADMWKPRKEAGSSDPAA